MFQNVQGYTIVSCRIVLEILTRRLKGELFGLKLKFCHDQLIRHLFVIETYLNKQNAIS